jgi:type I restriction enzyme, S subunit
VNKLAEKKNIPEIRLKGFSGAWEERELGEVADNIMYGMNCASTAYDGKNKYLRITDIDEDSRKFIASGVTSPLGSLESKYRLSESDVLFTRTGASVGKTLLYTPDLGNVYFAGFLIRFSITSAHPMFIFLQTLQKRYFKWVKGMSMRSGQPGINAEEYKSFKIFIPSLTEQQKIGTYFQNLDNLITQHQAKYNKLSILKKAMLEKMLPKNGKDIPEIRFKGFSGAWEEKNWEETVDISTNMVDPKIEKYNDLFHIGPGNIESFSGRIYDNVLKVKNSNLISGKFHFKKDDIIYGKINPQLAKYIIAPFEGLASADAYVLNAKNGAVQNYLYVILQTSDFYKYSVSVSSRTGMPKINRDELGVYNYLAPNVIEQQKIGTYFQNLDKLITLHKKELDKLKNLKKACLEKMFV